MPSKLTVLGYSYVHVFNRTGVGYSRDVRDLDSSFLALSHSHSLSGLEYSIEVSRFARRRNVRTWTRRVVASVRGTSCRLSRLASFGAWLLHPVVRTQPSGRA